MKCATATQLCYDPREFGMGGPCVGRFLARIGGWISRRSAFRTPRPALEGIRKIPVADLKRQA
jgi:hypothetical protein